MWRTLDCIKCHETWVILKPIQNRTYIVCAKCGTITRQITFEKVILENDNESYGIYKIKIDTEGNLKIINISESENERKRIVEIFREEYARIQKVAKVEYENILEISRKEYEKIQLIKIKDYEKIQRIQVKDYDKMQNVFSKEFYRKKKLENGYEREI